MISWRFGRAAETTEQTLCFCLAAKRTKKQVFVSFSLPVSDASLSLLVEERIKKELQLHPEHF